jgi:uncharacterized protein
MSSPYPPVTLPNSEVRMLESSIVNDTNQLSIALPFDYDQSDAHYPVVYAAPANPDIFILWTIASELSYSQEMPPLIIVGIGYPTDDPFDLLRLRVRDHMPAPDEEMDREIAEILNLETVRADGAGDFLQFIREELQPFIHANYRAKPDDSAYVGFSSGGLFGLYALFSHPDTFERYVCGSPPIFRSNKGILKDEQNYAQDHDDLPARLFLSVGGREETDDPFLVIKPSYQFVTNVNILAKTLQERNYPSLKLTTHVFEGETHLSVFPAAYSQGLREVFK